uniref:Uncharacterized protein n=1 Tax=Anopheles culicifacies TaxID=139723 RepID=A0A182MJ96_9DIPT
MTMMVDNFECAGYTFYSKFDSGNLGKVELVRCCEGLGIVGNTVSNVVGGVTSGAGGGNGAPVIGSGSSIVSNTGITSASAIVAATLGIGLQQQQHHGLLSSTTGSANGGSITAGTTSSLGLP